MHVKVYDRVTGEVWLTTELNAEDIVARGDGRYGIGESCPADERIEEADWRKRAGLPAPVAPAPEVNKVMAGEGLPMPVDDLADARTVPGGGTEKLEAIEREVDEANGKLTPAQVEALDRDGDGKPGGSKKRTPEEEAERAEIIASLREKGVTFFAGASTEKLKALLAEGSPE
ncbi:MAG TPA: hypothetical protein VGN74_05615 [Brevundimonas sp.]|jgi:hypothetical protein|uniref:hypothetical protein n=1 Tax=Brevundimonas sp. TaxID=1871086 RepID=UPI002E122747|nr:hypothetical protein [Brevundimonas sp.]